jgi:hypothetical protein
MKRPFLKRVAFHTSTPDRFLHCVWSCEVLGQLCGLHHLARDSRIVPSYRAIRPISTPTPASQVMRLILNAEDLHIYPPAIAYTGTYKALHTYNTILWEYTSPSVSGCAMLI